VTRTNFAIPLSPEVLDQFCGHAPDDSIRRDIYHYGCAGTDNCAWTDSHAGEDRDPRADPGTSANADRLATQIASPPISWSDVVSLC
jgi:hypothetical protein